MLFVKGFPIGGHPNFNQTSAISMANHAFQKQSASNCGLAVTWWRDPL